MFIGILYLFLTFLFCFILVHGVKLTILGIRYVKKPREEEKKPVPKPEPVYYIVEKKRTKKTYSEPKEIEFRK